MDTKANAPQSQPHTSNALIKPTPTQGFSVLYHATTNILLELPGSVVKTYLALTTLAVGRREQPAIKLWLMGLLNLKEEQMEAAIEMLIAEGLLYILPRKGKSDEWYLLPPKIEVPDNNVVYPASPLHTSVPDSTAVAASPPAAMAASNGSGSSRELTPADYWTAYPEAGKFLKALFDKWPKPTTLQEAQDAWVEMLGGVTMTRELQEQIWNGFNWWLRYWKSENTTQQYIPALSNWIRKERWRDARVVASN